jgi:LuxR family maltose regulon positive regulatory protein
MLDAASQWVEERELDTESGPTYMKEKEYMALARILIAQGRLAETAGLLQRLLKATEAGERTSRVIEILLLQALAFQAGDDTEQAIPTLERALAFAEPEGFIRTFVDEGPPMARLLYEALDRRIAPDYVRRLLAAFPIIEPEKTAPSAKVPKFDWIEPLSEREIEVLELVAKGLTNQEIASRLILSLHTIKAHTRNIYSKLDVHSRTEAVARCRALGILPST